MLHVEEVKWLWQYVEHLECKILVIGFFKMTRNIEKPNLITDIGISCDGFEMEIPILVCVYSYYNR